MADRHAHRRPKRAATQAWSTPARQRSKTPIVPLERLRVPARFSGVDGRFRGSASTLSAQTDLDAVHAWLRAKGTRPATERVYRKEAERLLLWAILVRQRAVSSLTAEDAQAFVRFLGSKPPADWISSVESRSSDAWRPFRGRLSPQSVKHAVGVIGGLFTYLTKTGYLLANPFAEVEFKDDSAPTDWVEGRAFTPAEWNRVMRLLPAYERAGRISVRGGVEKRVPLSPAQSSRLRFVLEFLYGTGLRLSELAKAELTDIHTNSKGAHWLKVEKSKGKPGEVVVPERAYQALDSYLEARGVGSIARPARRKEPLLASVQRNRTSSRLGFTQTASLCKEFFAFAAEKVHKPEFQSKLQLASTHWLRHTHASHLVDGGTPIAHVRDNLRHASLATTSRYVHTDKEARGQSVNEFFKKRASRDRLHPVARRK